MIKATGTRQLSVKIHNPFAILNPMELVVMRILSLTLLLLLTTVPAKLHAQIFDSGPSDALLFDSVIDVPPTSILAGSIVGDSSGSTQVNVENDGAVGNDIKAVRSEVNIMGGTVGDRFESFRGEVNLEGGSIGGTLIPQKAKSTSAAGA